MTVLTFQIQSAERPSGLTDDDALGEFLVGLCRDAIGRRAAGPAALVVRAGRVDFVSLRSPGAQGVDPKVLLAAMTRMNLRDEDEAVEAVGVIGIVSASRGPGPAVPVAMTFLEWTDCRWWHWHALMDADGAELLTDTETVRCAVEGDAKPMGLGGWWTLARHRTELSLRLRQVVH